MNLRPDPKLTAVVAVMLAILISLGIWQLRRNGETNAFLDRVDDRLDAAPLTAITGPPEASSWHRAKLDGAYIGEPLLMTGRYEFGEPGFDVIQGFDIDGGPTILVNRGFIPKQRLDVLDTPPGTTVEGLVLDIAEFEGDPQAKPIPANETSPIRWPRDSYAAMALEVGAEPVLVVAGAGLEPGEQKSAAVLPATGWMARPKVSPHLQYAGTWFMIAATLVVIWFGHAWQRGRA